MSTWRRESIETFPDLRQEFEQPDTTIYQVFLDELLPRTPSIFDAGPHFMR